LAVALIAQVTSPTSREVPYPEGYRSWQHVCSAVMPPKKAPADAAPTEDKIAAPHGLMLHVYANEKAVEGYRTGHFPEGAVLIADWFVLQERGPSLIQGPRKSVNVMVRDARYAETGGWGFEDFDKDSHVTRNIGAKAVTSCFECHKKGAGNPEFVFTTLKP
jgi:hypothetical protein